MRSAARPEGRGDADRGPLQHSTRQAGDIRAVGRRCQMRVSQFASLFVSFSVLLVETQQFSTRRDDFHLIALAVNSAERAPRTMRVLVRRSRATTVEPAPPSSPLGSQDVGPRPRGELMPTGSDFSDEDLHRLLPREACGFECILVGCEGLGSLQKRTRKVGRTKVEACLQQRQVGWS